MPRIRRYFPCSQGLNRDPEVRRLKKECGLTGFSMWLEILAQTDPTEGFWKGSERDIGSILAGSCESNTRGAAKLLQWVADIGWIDWQRGSENGHRYDLFVVNHANYHGGREKKNTSPRESKQPLPSEPSRPSEPSKFKDPAPAADLLNKERGKIQTEIEVEVKQLVTKCPDIAEELGRWLRHAYRKKLPAAVILEALRKSAPYLDSVGTCYKYLETASKQKAGSFNAKKSEDESAWHKAEERKYLGLQAAGGRG